MAWRERGNLSLEAALEALRMRPAESDVRLTRSEAAALLAHLDRVHKWGAGGPCIECGGHHRGSHGAAINRRDA